MTEEKSLLLKDLCARLPYKIEVYYSKTIPISTLKTINFEKGTCIVYDHSKWYRHTKLQIEVIKPYLRPMTSMTKKEEEEWLKCEDEETIVSEHSTSIDWLLSHHFDYRDLISKGLALEAPEGMYKI